MTILQEKTKNKQGYTLHIVETEKYKTNNLVIKLKSPLDKDTVTKRGLLPHVLQSSTNKYKTTTSLQSYLEELYGANFYIDLAKKGEYHVITLSLEIANEKFLKESEPLLQKGLQFLSEVLLKPNVENEMFHEETVEKEKRNQKVRIQAVYDDKMRYANSRLVEEMCKGEPFALHANGIYDEVDSITASSLYEYYQTSIQEDQIDIYVIGDVNEGEVDSMCEGIFTLNERTPKKLQHGEKSSIAEVNEVIEKEDVKQGKLNVGYRTNIRYGDPEYFALQLFNGIFGGFSHSKLFINVREKASLAYYAASRLESHKGLMMVMSGIDFKNYEQAVGIIKEQLEAMKNGDFTDGEMDQTKAVIHNQLLETIDTARGLIEVLYHNVVSDTSTPLNEWLEKIQAVTKDDVVHAAQKVETDTIYFLTGMEE